MSPTLSAALLLFIFAIAGLIAGVIVNLLADYLPARRLHVLASQSPFVSESAIPPLPRPLPTLSDGRRAPIYAWSGVFARLTGVISFREPRWTRRLLVEFGLMMAFPAIITGYPADVFPLWPSIGFLLVYAAALVLYVVVDIEYRWIMTETILPIMAIGLFEALLGTRLPLIIALRGLLYSAGIMLILYLLGILFGNGLGVLRGRRIGRTILGFGDVRLAVLGGVILGWPNIGFALLIMVFTGAIGAISLIGSKIIRTGRYRGFAAIPYGPYIAIGIAVMLYMPESIGALLLWLKGWN
jgi:prepilin signal peptidase PulO-like enzyme (type II secretory pathway)